MTLAYLNHLSFCQTFPENTFFEVDGLVKGKFNRLRFFCEGKPCSLLSVQTVLAKLMTLMIAER